MPTSLLQRTALSSSRPVWYSTLKYCKNLLSKMWRYLLSTIEVPRQYPSLYSCYAISFPLKHFLYSSVLKVKTEETTEIYWGFKDKLQMKCCL